MYLFRAAHFFNVHLAILSDLGNALARPPDLVAQIIDGACKIRDVVDGLLSGFLFLCLGLTTGCQASRGTGNLVYFALGQDVVQTGSA